MTSALATITIAWADGPGWLLGWALASAVVIAVVARYPR